MVYYLHLFIDLIQKIWKIWRSFYRTELVTGFLKNLLILLGILLRGGSATFGHFFNGFCFDIAGGFLSDRTLRGLLLLCGLVFVVLLQAFLALVNRFLKFEKMCTTRSKLVPFIATNIYSNFLSTVMPLLYRSARSSCSLAVRASVNNSDGTRVFNWFNI